MPLTIKRITKIVPGLCAWGLAQAREGIENDLGMRFVKIPAGTFTMGTAVWSQYRARQITSANVVRNYI